MCEKKVCYENKVGHFSHLTVSKSFWRAVPCHLLYALTLPGTVT